MRVEGNTRNGFNWIVWDDERSRELHQVLWVDDQLNQYCQAADVPLRLNAAGDDFQKVTKHAQVQLLRMARIAVINPKKPWDEQKGIELRSLLKPVKT